MSKKKERRKIYNFVSKVCISGAGAVIFWAIQLFGDSEPLSAVLVLAFGVFLGGFGGLMDAMSREG